MAFVVGVLCAALLGIESTSSASSGGDMAVTGTVEMRVVPGLSLLGFLIGAPFGAMIGRFWGRKGLLGIVGFILVSLTGGFAGLTAAALLGAQTRVTVSGNGISMEHGAPMPVLAAGAALGLVLGALGAWRFDYRRPVSDRQQVLAAPGAADVEA